MGRVELYRQPSIDVRSDGAVRIVTLNEPDALNAFTEDLHEQFVDVWADVERDSECRAAVNGPAVGLGCTVVTLCDIVFIAETAFLSDTHVAVALVAGDGGAVTWPAHTSLLRAKQYLLTGDRLAATEAVDLGLANFVVPGDRLIEEATAYAHRLAALPPQAVQETKALLNQHLRANAVRALGLGLAAEYQSHEQPEYREAGERLRPRDR